MIDYVITAFRDFFAQGFHMYPIFIVVLVGCIIQVVKVIIDLIRYKRFYIGHKSAGSEDMSDISVFISDISSLPADFLHFTADWRAA